MRASTIRSVSAALSKRGVKISVAHWERQKLSSIVAPVVWIIHGRGWPGTGGPAWVEAVYSPMDND
jgi:hypothetical protein